MKKIGKNICLLILLLSFYSFELYFNQGLCLNQI